ncbi:hypothetical protein ABER02_13425 [Rossellomorea marisflavi]|uniref:hypothetical protein n=1 Tax=Rossellomorea marisflavi TaxID=189381 RepID=UPI003D2A1287
MKILFMPYKATMWDSLESIYTEALKDDDCEVTVVPIPYYQLSNNGPISTYEGSEFPEYVSVTPYKEYSLEEEKPDIIYICA